MTKPRTISSSWQQLLLLITILSIMVASSSSFQSSINTNTNNQKSKSSSLAYAASSTAGPMSQVDPNARSGGCPFLVTSLDAQRTYAVPALFHPSDEQRPIVLFDGSCTLCNNFVQFLLKYDKTGNLRFAALQSKVGELLLRRMSEEVRNEVLHDVIVDDNDDDDASSNKEEQQYKSLVLCTPDSTYIQSSAVLKILGSLSSTSAKRIKLLQYVGLAGYVLPTRIRDRVYKFVSKRRKSWFGSADECMLYDDRFDDRFVDDGVLTGVFRDPFADPNAAQTTNDDVLNLFEGESPPQRGDQVQIIWPQNSNVDPSVTYDDEFPNGLCLVGGRGKITNVDLPMRVVMRVDRKSIGLEMDDMGEETMIAWVKPSEVALV
ncbi:thiol-disulfide oxidoreductase DCC family protein [Skeletonema marinoi]|uniref:Thiol-disulfide oxidoreductase DCC family protein n=1 Tax=Skeletonema marinoi TaxID=267567 RepID=A0AAD8XRV9_9STRA|nr:thiol-disulfide oxidoreductase DCC family protein [Skeletonema marinoi]